MSRSRFLLICLASLLLFSCMIPYAGGFFEDFAALAKKGPPRCYTNKNSHGSSSDEDSSPHRQGKHKTSDRELSSLIGTELERVFGYSKLRGLQEKVIKTLLNGKDVFAVMPTGAGKSLCYQVIPQKNFMLKFRDPLDRNVCLHSYKLVHSSTFRCAARYISWIRTSCPKICLCASVCACEFLR
jgi:hypothetical protein